MAKSPANLPARCLLHDEKLDAIDVKLDRVLLLLDGGPGEPGLRLEVDRLKGTRKFAVTAFWIAVTAVAGTVATRLFP